MHRFFGSPGYRWLPFTLLAVVLAGLLADVRWRKDPQSLIGMTLYSWKLDTWTGERLGVITALEMNHYSPPDVTFDAAVVTFDTPQQAGQTLLPRNFVPIDSIARFGFFKRYEYSRGFRRAYFYYTNIPPHTWLLWIATLMDLGWLALLVPGWMWRRLSPVKRWEPKKGCGQTIQYSGERRPGYDTTGNPYITSVLKTYLRPRFTGAPS